MLTLNSGIRRRKPQATALSPIQFAWRRTWKARVYAGLRYAGLGLASLGLLIVGWALTVLMFSF